MRARSPRPQPSSRPGGYGWQGQETQGGAGRRRHQPPGVHRYELLDRLECGVVLRAPRSRRCASGGAQIKDGYAHVRDGELWLHNVHIPPYGPAARENHEPEAPQAAGPPARDRAADGQVKERGLTIVPTRIYFKDGRAKVEIALGRGKDRFDKRQTIKARSSARHGPRADALTRPGPVRAGAAATPIRRWRPLPSGAATASRRRPARRPRRVRGSIARPIGARPVDPAAPGPRLAGVARGAGRGGRPTTRRSRACTSCCCARRASRSTAAAPRAAPARRAISTTSPTRRRRRAGRGAGQARRLPRREPLHDLGLQVRPARGRREAAPARLAGPRGAARARGLAAASPTAAPSPQHDAETAELLAALARGDRATTLTPHQREVLVALTLNGVPIDVLAERLQHHPRRALQDAARRPPQAARAPRRARARRRPSTNGSTT